MQLQFYLFYLLVYDFVEHAIEICLIDVFLRIHQQGLCLFAFFLYHWHVWSQLLQLLPLLLGNFKQLQKVIWVLRANLIDQIKGLIFHLNQVLSPQLNSLMVWLLFFENLNQERCRIEFGISELGVWCKKILNSLR